MLGFLTGSLATEPPPSPGLGANSTLARLQRAASAREHGAEIKAGIRAWARWSSSARGPIGSAPGATSPPAGCARTDQFPRRTVSACATRAAPRFPGLALRPHARTPAPTTPNRAAADGTLRAPAAAPASSRRVGRSARAGAQPQALPRASAVHSL